MGITCRCTWSEKQTTRDLGRSGDSGRTPVETENGSFVCRSRVPATRETGLVLFKKMHGGCCDSTTAEYLSVQSFREWCGQWYLDKHVSLFRMREDAMESKSGVPNSVSIQERNLNLVVVNFFGEQQWGRFSMAIIKYFCYSTFFQTVVLKNPQQCRYLWQSQNGNHFIEAVNMRPAKI